MNHDTLRGELIALLEAPTRTPAQLRRVAELTELLYDEEAARIWWHTAAAAGDESAIAILDLLDAEGEEDYADVEMILAQTRALLLRLAAHRTRDTP